MTTDRPYRPGLSKQAAVQELFDCSGRLYDPALVDSFVAALEGEGSPSLDPSTVSLRGAAAERADAQ